MLRLTLSLVILVAVAGLAPADEIIFKQDYGDGKSVQCQVYKETEDYIHYIDIKKDQDAGCSREIVEQIVKSEKPLVDVQAFFLRKAAEAKDKTAADAAKAKAEEFRKAEEARATAAKKPGGEKKGKLTMRPITEGVKVVAPSTPGGNAELIVDPFPEEDKTPPPPPKSGKTDPPKTDTKK